MTTAVEPGFAPELQQAHVALALVENSTYQTKPDEPDLTRSLPGGHCPRGEPSS